MGICVSCRRRDRKAPSKLGVGAGGGRVVAKGAAAHLLPRRAASADPAMANSISNIKMTNPIKGIVSKRRKRYIKDGFNLDLTYITDRLIAMGFPAEKLEGVYRNHIDEVARFLEQMHKDHYKIYNLCSERSYDSSKFHERVERYAFDDHTPPNMELIQPFCEDVHQWLSEDSRNVAAVHCKAGKGRTGTMVCCYLLYSGQKATADEALKFYGTKRTHDEKGVTIPLQRRYVEYYGALVRSGLQYRATRVHIRELIMTPPPPANGGHCAIEITLSQATPPHKAPMGWQEVSRRGGSVCVTLAQCTPLCGDVRVDVFAKPKMMIRREKLFHFWFNTFFVVNCVGSVQIPPPDDSMNLETYKLTLNKWQLDDAHKDKQHKLYSADFKVEVIVQKQPESSRFGGGVRPSRAPPSPPSPPSPPDSTDSSCSEGDTETDAHWDSGNLPYIHLSDHTDTESAASAPRRDHDDLISTPHTPSDHHRPRNDSEVNSPVFSDRANLIDSAQRSHVKVNASARSKDGTVSDTETSRQTRYIDSVNRVDVDRKCVADNAMCYNFYVDRREHVDSSKCSVKQGASKDKDLFHSEIGGKVASDGFEKTRRCADNNRMEDSHTFSDRRQIGDDWKFLSDVRQEGVHEDFSHRCDNWGMDVATGYTSDNITHLYENITSMRANNRNIGIESNKRSTSDCDSLFKTDSKYIDTTSKHESFGDRKMRHLEEGRSLKDGNGCISDGSGRPTDNSGYFSGGQIGTNARHRYETETGSKKSFFSGFRHKSDNAHKGNVFSQVTDSAHTSGCFGQTSDEVATRQKYKDERNVNPFMDPAMPTNFATEACNFQYVDSDKTMDSFKQTKQRTQFMRLSDPTDSVATTTDSDYLKAKAQATRVRFSDPTDKPNKDSYLEASDPKLILDKSDKKYVQTDMTVDYDLKEGYIIKGPKTKESKKKHSKRDDIKNEKGKIPKVSSDHTISDDSKKKYTLFNRREKEEDGMSKPRLSLGDMRASWREFSGKFGSDSRKKRDKDESYKDQS